MSSDTAPLRKGPSGPKAAAAGVDVYSTAIDFTDLSTFAPGVYLVVNTGVLALPVLTTDPQAPIGLLTSGVEARPGKIARCRIATIFPSTTAGSAPYKLQWLVDGVAAGPEVTVPWAPVGSFVGSPTLADVQALLKNSFPLPDDFGCSWTTGQNVTLQMTLGAFVFAPGDGAVIVLAFEKDY